MAKPQRDGYDSGRLAELDLDRFGWQKQSRSDTARYVIAEGLLSIAKPAINMTMGEGTVYANDITDGELTEINRYLWSWDAGYTAIMNYLDEFWPYRAATGGRGCSSGHNVMSAAHPFHCVYVTVNDAQGCAQGIYHEMAHLRLETMGIGIEKHDGRLLENGPDELFDSSVRFDVKRPMSAVLHGLYAWLMFVENDWQVLQSNGDVELFKQYSAHNVPKIVNGVREVSLNARWTPEGYMFAAGLFEWSDDLVRRCREVLIA